MKAISQKVILAVAIGLAVCSMTSGCAYFHPPDNYQDLQKPQPDSGFGDFIGNAWMGLNDIRIH